MARKKTASYWMNKIAKSSKLEKKWRDRGSDIVNIYRNEAKKDISFNILFSNTQTIKPAVYSATPKPDVRKRWKSENKTADEAAEILERAINFSIDSYEFDTGVSLAVDDMLLPGRGVARVRYVPEIEEVERQYEEESIDELGEPIMVMQSEIVEQIASQDVYCEFVYWEDFRMGSARNWEDVPWIAFRHKFSESQVKENFEDIDDETISKMDFSFAVDDDDEGTSKSKSKTTQSSDDLAIVWEVWCKETRMVYWITSGVSGFLEKSDDPLNLTGFFPVPKPIYAVETTNTLVPRAFYDIYESLARELDRIETRILKITDALKVRGAYPQDLEELQNMLQLDDNQMLGIKDFSAYEGKRLEDFVMFAPVEQLAKVLVVLTGQREQTKQVIFEVTGISDILRGQTKASETLGAQQIKAQFGTARLEAMLKRVRIFARDLIRMKGEIIAQEFTPEHLELMTGLPVSDEVMAMLRSDVLRDFNIDIETDSTVAIDRAGEKEEVQEVLNAITGFMTSIAPFVESGTIPVEAAKDMLKWGIRSFKGSRHLEDAIDQIGIQPQLPQQTIPQEGVPPVV